MSRRRTRSSGREEGRFRGLLAAAPDAIVGVDRSRRIVLVNGQAERTFGYEREELLGQPLELLLPTRLRAAHVRHRAGCYADPRTRPMGLGRDLTGEERDLGLFWAAIDEPPPRAQPGVG
jgi:PAS domain S-box-containing protein